MKLIGKILAVLLASALLGAVIAPWVQAFLISVCHAQFPFHRVLNRCVLFWLILFLFLFRRNLFPTPLGRMGLARTAGWKSELGGGALFALLSFAAMMAIYILIGARAPKLGFLSLRFVARFFEYGLAAVFIGFFEEIFFRGFILQGLLETQRRCLAVTVASIFYAVTHFLKPESAEAAGNVTLLYSLKSLLRFLEPLQHIEKVLPFFVGLFLLGVVLSYAYLKTNRLYYSIGLHGMWVFCIKMSGSFVSSTPLGRGSCLFGDSRVVNGYMGWGLMVVAFLWVHYFVPGKKRSW